jgi:hypothetical protein
MQIFDSSRTRFSLLIRVTRIGVFFSFFYPFFFPYQPIQGCDAPAQDALLPANLLIEQGQQAQTQLT